MGDLALPLYQTSAQPQPSWLTDPEKKNLPLVFANVQPQTLCYIDWIFQIPLFGIGFCNAINMLKLTQYQTSSHPFTPHPTPPPHTHTLFRSSSLPQVCGTPPPGSGGPVSHEVGVEYVIHINMLSDRGMCATRQGLQLLAIDGESEMGS